MSFRLREFRPEDLERVIFINRTCLPENYTRGFFLSTYRSFPDLFLVAEVDGVIVGYIMCRIERSIWGIRGARGHVISIAVMPEHRRKGIGTALLREALSRMAERYGVGECFLEVRVSNTPAISLYEKLGFVRKTVLKGYYLDGEDAYLMSKSLSSFAS